MNDTIPMKNVDAKIKGKQNEILIFFIFGELYDCVVLKANIEE